MSRYLTAVVADAPRHYWRCADPGGVLLNDVGSSPRALIEQGSAPLSGYSGPISDGGAVVISANNGFANVEAEAIPIPYSFELLFWQPYISPVTTAMADCEGPAGFTTFLVRANSSSQVLVFGGGGLAATLSGVAMRTWHHLVLVVTAGSSIVYFDGAAQAPTAGTAVGTNNTYWLGTTNANTNGTAAGLAEFAQYNTALSAGRVAAHYAAIDQGTQPPVYGASGGVGGGGSSVSNPVYLGILQQILQAVRHTFPTTA